MRIEEKNRHEIEARLVKMGDYVKMDYLNDCLKSNLDFDTRKFVLIKLAGIYEGRKMYHEAGKLYKIIAELSTSVQSKINDYLKSGEFFVKAGKFSEADLSFDRALGIANATQKFEIDRAMKEFYKTQARAYLTRRKRRNAMEVYEKLMSLSLSLEERKEIKSALLELYKDLGKVREFGLLKGRQI